MLRLLCLIATSSADAMPCFNLGKLLLMNLDATSVIGAFIIINLMRAAPNPYTAPSVFSPGSGEVAAVGFCGSLLEKSMNKTLGNNYAPNTHFVFCL